jgi:hypothetical protein
MYNEKRIIRNGISLHQMFDVTRRLKRFEDTARALVVESNSRSSDRLKDNNASTKVSQLPPLTQRRAESD